MNNRQLILILFIYSVLFIVLFPSYQYLINPDATGYLSVSEKIANKNYFNSINGIWSPLGSWLLVPFIKMGGDAIFFSKCLNGFYGFLSLIFIFKLLKKLEVDSFILKIIMILSIFLVLNFAFALLFGDFILLMILLGYLNIIMQKNFSKKKSSIIIASFIGAIAFYAKAYSFYFIILHLPITILFLEKKNCGKYFSILSLKKLFLALSVFLITTSFWLFALHHKYGNFILGQKNITGTLTQLSHIEKNLSCLQKVEIIVFLMTYII